MDFIWFIMFLVLIGIISVTKQKVKQMSEKIDYLENQIRDLYNKVYYSYNIIEQLQKKGKVSTHNDVSQEKVTENKIPLEAPVPVSTSVAVTGETSPLSDKVTSQEKPVVVEPAFKTEIPVKMPVREQTPVFSEKSAPKNYAAISAENLPDVGTQQPFPYSVPQQNVNPTHSNAVPKKIQPNTFENWLGTRLFNVAASLMIFIGLVLFCTLGYEYITNTMKMIAMFIVSGAFIGLGAFFTRQNKSVFSLGLTGCGFGAFFISILLSHVYFHAIVDAAAFGLLLVWAIFALFMSKKLDSLMLSVTAHMGTAVSICFAFSMGFSADKIILPVIYQFAAISVIVIGNIFFSKKMYRFGLSMSEILLVYTSFVMFYTFSASGKVSVLSIAVIFIIQMLSISFISYLISVSAAALSKSNSKYRNMTDSIHIINKFFWVLGMFFCSNCPTYYILRSMSDTYNVKIVSYAAMAIIIPCLIHVLITFILSEKLNFNDELSKISVWYMSVTITFSLFVAALARSEFKGMPFLFVYTALIMALVYYTKNVGLNKLIRFLIGCEMSYMVLCGYFIAANLTYNLIYMFIIGIVVLSHWFMQSGESRQRRFCFFKMAEYIWLSVSIIPINVSGFSNNSLALILCEFAFINILARLIHYAKDGEPELKTAVRIESYITIYFGMLVFTFDGFGGLGKVLALKIILTVLLAVLTAMYVRDFIKTGKAGLQALAAFTTAGFITFFCAGVGSSLKLAEIYADVLQCKPFFFIASVMMIITYARSKNHELRVFIWAAMGFDMFLMIVSGYAQLIEMYGSSEVLKKLLLVSASVIHAGAVSVMLYAMWLFQEETKKHSPKNIDKVIAYLWVNLSIGVITSLAVGEMISVELAMLVVTLINVAAYAAFYGERGTLLNLTVKIISCIVLYSVIIKIAVPINSNGTYIEIQYIVRLALILAVVGLYFLIARDLMINYIKFVWVQVVIGLTALFIVNAVCNGLSNLFTIVYIFSIASMITALVCIAVGFIAKAKGLRIYGLIVVMLCVIKLVTIDISGADSMARVAAFVIGGIVCFIISGIYNKVESRLIKHEHQDALGNLKK